MSFEEKSSWVVLLAFVVTYGWYFHDVMVAGGGDHEGYQARLLGMVVIFVVLVIVAHVIIAIADPQGSDARDERDRSISRFGDYVGSYVLVGASLTALGMAMAELPHFYIAHAILAGMVLSEIVGGLVKVWRYRRGF